MEPDHQILGKIMCVDSVKEFIENSSIHKHYVL